MYTEGYDELSEAENKPQRHYVSAIPQSDSNKMQREIDRLKKSLEKEQFFNKLLDQELKDVKSLQSGQQSYDPYWHENNKGVSKGAFYSLLIVTLALAGFISYTLYNNKQYNLFQDRTEAVSAASVPGSENTAAGLNAATGKDAVSDNSGKTTGNADNKTGSVAVTPLASRKIEGVSSGAASNTASPDNALKPAGNDRSQKNPAATNGNGQPNTSVPARPLTDSVPNIIANGNVPSQTDRSATVSQPAGSAAAGASSGLKADQPAENTVAQAPVPDTRPVIATYRVSSKANFYSAPDENTLRSTFIAQGNDKTVNALEDKNGFIYVEYTNDLGYVSKGWLSKADLTKVQ